MIPAVKSDCRPTIGTHDTSSQVTADLRLEPVIPAVKWLQTYDWNPWYQQSSDCRPTIGTHDTSSQVTADLHLRPPGHSDLPQVHLTKVFSVVKAQARSRAEDSVTQSLYLCTSWFRQPNSPEIWLNAFTNTIPCDLVEIYWRFEKKLSAFFAENCGRAFLRATRHHIPRDSIHNNVRCENVYSKWLHFIPLTQNLQINKSGEFLSGGQV